MRCGAMRLAAEGPARRARPARRRRAAAMALARAVGLGRGSTGARGAAARRPQRGARAARLRQADRDRLLGRARAVLALPDVMHLLAHELSGGGGCAPSAPQVSLRPLRRGSLWHEGPPYRAGLETCSACPVPFRAMM